MLYPTAETSQCSDDLGNSILKWFEELNTQGMPVVNACPLAPSTVPSLLNGASLVSGSYCHDTMINLYEIGLVWTMPCTDKQLRTPCQMVPG